MLYCKSKRNDSQRKEPLLGFCFPPLHKPRAHLQKSLSSFISKTSIFPFFISCQTGTVFASCCVWCSYAYWSLFLPGLQGQFLLSLTHMKPYGKYQVCIWTTQGSVLQQISHRGKSRHNLACRKFSPDRKLCTSKEQAQIQLPENNCSFTQIDTCNFCTFAVKLLRQMRGSARFSVTAFRVKQS